MADEQEFSKMSVDKAEIDQITQASIIAEGGV